MQQSSLKRNYFFNLISSVTTLLFPLITFPYTSRILLADGIGEVAYLRSIISYITIFSALGIPLYAIREISRDMDNKIKYSRTAIEIILLHTFLTFFGYLIVGILCISVENIYNEAPLFILLSTSLLLNALGATWFYQGIEDFKYITIRGIVVKIVSVILLFTTVKSKSDLIFYAAANVIAEGGGNIFNFIRLRKYITINKHIIRDLNCFRHVKPALKTFVLNISTSIYLHLDSVMLGSLSTHNAVGYYTAANSIVRPSMTIIISLGGVLLPRLSNLLGNSRTEEFNQLVKKTMNFGLLSSIPMSLGLIILSRPIVQLFCGITFEPSILAVRIMAPMIIPVTLSCFMMPILYSSKMESIPLAATIIGAIVNIALNLFLIPHYMEIGAATSTLIAEFCVMYFMFVKGRKYVNWGIEIRKLVLYTISSIIMLIFLSIIIRYFVLSDFFLLLICVPSGIFTYLFCLYLSKDKDILVFFSKNMR